LNIIDFSQFSTYQYCPLKWYERYQQRRVPKQTRQRDDAMALGSLVHDGLQNWFQNGSPTVLEGSVEEVNPTPDTLQTANFLLQAYVMRYPREEFALQGLEEPLTFPIGMDDWMGMAKIDRYFEVNAPGYELVANEDGHTIYLEPGIWIMEHKTKSASKKRSTYMLGWEVNRQASFQLLAAKHKFGDKVRGIIVNVIEKPREYVPRRKCGGCNEMYELASFIPAFEGKYSCQVCGFVQKLSPYKPQKERTCSFFRIKVTRDANALEQHLGEIVQMADRMKAAMNGGFMMPTTTNCVHDQYGPCEYFNNHLYNISVLDDPDMEEKDTSKYMGLTLA
jgi:hypothetical protein